MRRTLLFAILCGLGAVKMAHAAEEKPCLIFSGETEARHLLDLEEFNRITFGEHSMTISHSDKSENRIELLYSAYHRFRVGSGIPSVSAIDEIPDADTESFVYERLSQTLKICGESENVYAVGIFNLTGTLIARAELRGGESVSVKTLEPAVYIAVAVNGKDVKKIKFVK